MYVRLDYYIAAGISIQIDVEKQEGLPDWCVRIGCHNDDLKNCNELRRWHYISICKPLTTETVTLGLLFLKVQKKNQVQLRFVYIMLPCHHHMIFWILIVLIHENTNKKMLKVYGQIFLENILFSMFYRQVYWALIVLF